MKTNIEAVHQELSITVQSDDITFCTNDARRAAAQYILDNHHGEGWLYLDIGLDNYDRYTVRYRREPQEADPRDKRTDGPDW